MKRKHLNVIFLAVTFFSLSVSAQFRLNTKAIDAVKKTTKAVSFSDADAAGYAHESVLWMDAHNEVAGPTDKYTIRLNKIFGSHVNDSGFWMFKEFFGLTLKQTFLSWTLMETLISILGLIGVLLLDMFI